MIEMTTHDFVRVLPRTITRCLMCRSDGGEAQGRCADCGKVWIPETMHMLSTDQVNALVELGRQIEREGRAP